MKIGAVIFDLDGTLTKPVLDFDRIRNEMGLSHESGDILAAMAGMDPDQQRQAEVAQAMLKEVGIDATLKVLEFGQYFRKAYSYSYDMAIHVMTAAIDPDELLAPYYGRLKTSTYYKWSDPVLWEMIDKQRLMMNPRERAKYIQDIQRRVLDQAMNVFLFSWRWMGCAGPYLHFKSYLNDFQGSFAEDHWIELDKQKAWKAGK